MAPVRRCGMVLVLGIVACVHIHFFSRQSPLRDSTGRWGKSHLLVDCIHDRDDDISFVYPSPYIMSQSLSPEQDSAWNEFVPIVSEPPRAHPIGQRTAWDVHTQGIWHRDVGVIIKVGDSLLLQKRDESTKWVFPGLLDFSSAETMERNETFEDAAKRSIIEEMVNFDKIVKLPVLEKCCGPITFVWAGAMPKMMLRERHVLEVWRAAMSPEQISLNDLRSRKNGSAEVGGWELMKSDQFLADAKAAGAGKYCPWILRAIDSDGCESCWN